MSDASISVEDEAPRIRAAALDAMSHGVAIVGADGLIVHANDAAAPGIAELRR